MSYVTNTILSRREVYVNEIVFYSKNEISLFGFFQNDKSFSETQYVISRNDLQLLLSSNQTGIEILWCIENLFVVPHEVPASINLIDLFGITQVFEAESILLEVPFTENETPLNELLFVSRVRPTSTI
ncbi:MAG: hypothetical protein U0T74_06130 [Chitinophagales bacterium]